MFILDAPYASPALQQWLVDNNHPVLANPFARALVDQGVALNLVGEDEAAARINAKERVCTNSENALEWLTQHVTDESMLHGIQMCKDKELMRNVLNPLDQELFYKGCTFEELCCVSYSDLPEKVIVKPTVGFCSLGVYAVQSQQDWDAALASIRSDMSRWSTLYPNSVVGAGRFLIEQMIDGQEYALDMFYDQQGAPHVLNVFQHDFASASDTSDRLYWCSADLQKQTEELFIPWLISANELMQLRDFCIHIEVRVNQSGVHVIELNPLRFAGCGGTDLSLYARGMLTYDALFNGRAMEDFVTDDRYAMALLMPAESTPNDATFDYDAFTAPLSGVLEMRKFQRLKMGAFGFMFAKVPNGPQGDSELSYILNEPLDPYIIA